jgi:ABC-type glycerol-3-phosphate transport system substrate-binding protein
MRRTLIALLAALALGACGGDDESGDSGDPPVAQETQTGTTDTTDTTTTSAGGGVRRVEISSCLDREGLNVIENPGSQVDAVYQLVVNSGGAGVLYGFADESAARSARSTDPQATAKVRRCAR